MGTNALPAAIEDDLSRGGMHSAAMNNSISHKSSGYFCEPRSAGLCSKLLRAIRISGRGRNGVTLSGDALPHELDQGQRETLAVNLPAEQHVQDAQDLRKVGLVRHLFIRQVEAAKAEEADINLLCGARGMKFVIRFRRLDELMKHR